MQKVLGSKPSISIQSFFFHFYPRIQHYPLLGTCNLYSKHVSMYKMCMHIHVNKKESLPNISCNYRSCCVRNIASMICCTICMCLCWKIFLLIGKASLRYSLALGHTNRSPRSLTRWQKQLTVKHRKWVHVHVHVHVHNYVITCTAYMLEWCNTLSHTNTPLHMYMYVHE